MSFKSEALEAIEKDCQSISRDATDYMRAKVKETCNKGFASGALAGSITNQRVAKWEWRVGSPLDYASYVNDGRGPVYPKPGNPWGKVYLKGLDIWRPAAGPAAAKHFVEATKEAIDV